MALSEDQIRQQINVLTQKTSENTEMVYKANAILNKALNPEFFSGNSTKIVNAINELALANSANEEALVAIANKVNSLLLDTSNDSNNIVWEEVKSLSGQDTVIEVINSILKGKNQAQILNFDIDDNGKVLTIATDENGQVTTLAQKIDEIISADKIAYSNNQAPDVTNIKDAIDYLIARQGEGGETTTPEYVEWNDIQNKPDFGSSLYLDTECLVLRNEYGDVISTVELITDSEIDELLED